MSITNPISQRVEVLRRLKAELAVGKTVTLEQLRLTGALLELLRNKNVGERIYLRWRAIVSASARFESTVGRNLNRVGVAARTDYGAAQNRLDGMLTTSQKLNRKAAKLILRLEALEAAKNARRP